MEIEIKKLNLGSFPKPIQDQMLEIIKDNLISEFEHGNIPDHEVVLAVYQKAYNTYSEQIYRELHEKFSNAILNCEKHFNISGYSLEIVKKWADEIRKKGYLIEVSNPNIFIDNI